MSGAGPDTPQHRHPLDRSPPPNPPETPPPKGAESWIGDASRLTQVDTTTIRTVDSSTSAIAAPTAPAAPPNPHIATSTPSDPTLAPQTITPSNMATSVQNPHPLVTPSSLGGGHLSSHGAGGGFTYSSAQQHHSPTLAALAAGGGSASPSLNVSSVSGFPGPAQPAQHLPAVGRASPVPPAFLNMNRSDSAHHHGAHAPSASTSATQPANAPAIFGGGGLGGAGGAPSFHSATPAGQHSGIDLYQSSHVMPPPSAHPHGGVSGSGIRSGIATADVSHQSYDDAALAQKRLELDLAVQQRLHALHHQIEQKDAKIAELSQYVEKVVVDFRYNFELVQQLNDKNERLERQLLERTSAVAELEQLAKENEAARVLLAEQLREHKRTHEEAITAHHEEAAAVQNMHERAQRTAQQELEAAQIESDRQIEVVRHQCQRRVDAEVAARNDAVSNAESKVSSLTRDFEHRRSEFEAKIRSLDERCIELRDQVDVARRAQSISDEERRALESLHNTAAAQRERHDDEQRKIREELDERLKQMSEKTAEAERDRDAAKMSSVQRLAELELECAALKARENTATERTEQAEQQRQFAVEQMNRTSEDWERRFKEMLREKDERILSLEDRLKNSDFAASSGRQREASAESDRARFMAEKEALEVEVAQGRKQRDALQQSVATLAQEVRHAEEQAFTAQQKMTRSDSEQRQHQIDIDERLAAMQRKVDKANEERTQVLERELRERAEVQDMIRAAETRATDAERKVALLSGDSIADRLKESETVCANLKLELEKSRAENASLRGHVSQITQELNSDPLIASNQEQQRRICVLEQQAEVLRAAVASNELDKNHHLREKDEIDAERTKHKFEKERWERDRAMWQEELTQERQRCEAILSVHQVVGGMSMPSSGAGGVTTLDPASPDGMHHHATSPGHMFPTVSPSASRLAAELQALRDKVAAAAGQASRSHAERADAVVEARQVKHKAELLLRERDELVEVNSMLRKELMKLQDELVVRDQQLITAHGGGGHGSLSPPGQHVQHYISAGPTPGHHNQQQQSHQVQQSWSESTTTRRAGAAEGESMQVRGFAPSQTPVSGPGQRAPASTSPSPGVSSGASGSGRRGSGAAVPRPLHQDPAVKRRGGTAVRNYNVQQ